MELRVKIKENEETRFVDSDNVESVYMDTDQKCFIKFRENGIFYEGTISFPMFMLLIEEFYN